MESQLVKAFCKEKEQGPAATSSALISDISSILRGNIKYPFGISSNKEKSRCL